MEHSVGTHFEHLCRTSGVHGAFIDAPLNTPIEELKPFNDEDLDVLLIVLTQILTQVTFVYIPLKVLTFLFKMVGLDHCSPELVTLGTFLDSPGADALGLFLTHFIEELSHDVGVALNLASDCDRCLV